MLPARTGLGLGRGSDLDCADESGNVGAGYICLIHHSNRLAHAPPRELTRQELTSGAHGGYSRNKIAGAFYLRFWLVSGKLAPTKVPTASAQ